MKKADHQTWIDSFTGLYEGQVSNMRAPLVKIAYISLNKHLKSFSTSDTLMQLIVFLFYSAL